MSAPIARMTAFSTASATPSAELVRLSVVVPAAQAEMALAATCAVLGSGCRETSLPDGRMCLEFWVARAGADGAAARLGAALAAFDGVELGQADEDPGWQTAMREFHQPVDVAGRIRVRPPWRAAAGDAVDVVIDPAMAFGTGQHDTTRGCLELVLTVAPGPLLDIGCGSGGLGIAAARLGFSPVWAWDLDPLAVQATIANARANGVALAVAPRDALVARLPAAEVVLANLTATILTALAARVAYRAPRAAILSGLRPHEVDPVCRAWAVTGLVPVDRRVGAEWGSVLLRRP
jgi:ribosomal protein L11 methyltransferase